MKNTRVKVRHTATHSPIARERASLWNGYWPCHCLIADSIPEPCHIRPLTHEKCEIKFLTVVLAVAPNALAPARYYNNNHFFSVRVRVSSWRMVRVCAMGKIDLGLSYIQWISVARFSIYHDEKREVVDGGARAHEKKKNERANWSAQFDRVSQSNAVTFIEIHFVRSLGERRMTWGIYIWEYADTCRKSV